MPRYMFLARAVKTSETAKARRRRLDKAAAALLGSVETLDAAFGADDLYTICELPTNAAAARFAACLRVDRTSVRTIALPAPPRHLQTHQPSVLA